MKTLCTFFIWCLLLVVCWPLAILALILVPLVWVLSIPFRILYSAVEGILMLVRALFLLPARLVGWGKP